MMIGNKTTIAEKTIAKKTDHQMNKGKTGEATISRDTAPQDRSQNQHALAMRPLYVIGGQQRVPRSILDQDQQWYDYQKGLILRLDPQTGQIEKCVEYVSPPDACAPGDAVLFKSGTVQGDKLYVCTQTEVLVYKLPEFKQIAYISLPSFNDVHHVRPTAEGNLLVAVSGLDMVMEMNVLGEVLREWDVYDGKPWTRFSRDIDYRMGVSTKPHKSHPNHLFLVGDEIWVTRFEQKDAICVNRPNRRIQIGTERIHDGYLHEGRLYFTTVNGTIVIANAVTLQIEETIDLSTIQDDETLLGWCRGILVEGTGAWVGFSRIRPTKFREAVGWVRVGFKQSLPTHIAYYDLAERRCITEIGLEGQSLNAVFSILPAYTGS
jgi:hypothetical protein